MLKRYILILISLLIVVLPVYVFAQISCPYALAVTEFVPAKEGWAEYKMTSAKILRGWEIYEGELGDARFLQAPTEQQKSNQVIQVWDLQPFWKDKKNVWLKCNYFETSAHLMRKIPIGTQQCVSQFKLDKNNNPVSGANVVCE